MTDTMREKPYWWPQKVDAEWRKCIRADYPDETKELDDDAIDDKYAEGWKYADTWDHLGDARHDYEQLADAFFESLAAQANARELIGELSNRAKGLLQEQKLLEAAMQRGRITKDEIVAINIARGNLVQALTKAQAFMEGKV